MGDQLKSNKEKVTELLEKRHKERQKYNANIHDIRKKNAPESEAVDYFESIFDKKINDLENELNSLQSDEAKSLAAVFNQINKNIQDLQKYLSNSTIFLTDYKIKKCQHAINLITMKSDKLKNILVPKKKFGFNKKSAAPIIQTPDNKLIKEKDSKNENIQKQQQFEWTISNECNKMFLLEENAVNNSDITISNLTNCVVQLHGHLDSLHMSCLTNCTILCGPVSRSVFADNCTGCKFTFACQQMRLHSSRSCDIYLHVTCRAIIEDCSDILFAPYNYIYPELNIDFIKAGLDKDVNNWRDIGDFNWLSPDKPSPNWRKMSECKYIWDWTSFLDDIRNNLRNI